MRPYARPLLLVVLVTACAAVGSEPLPGQPAHHVEGGFRNTDPAVQRASGGDRFKFMWSRAWAAARPSDVPRMANDGAALRANGSSPTVTWIGHATMLVQLQGTNLLTDPHWGERASPLSWAGPKRLQPPGLAFEDLPPIHVVLISHDHYDHLDIGTVKRLAAAHDPVFVVPLGLKAWFARRASRGWSSSTGGAASSIEGFASCARPPSISPSAACGTPTRVCGHRGRWWEAGDASTSAATRAISTASARSASGSAPSISPPWPSAPTCRRRSCASSTSPRSRRCRRTRTWAEPP